MFNLSVDNALIKRLADLYAMSMTIDASLTAKSQSSKRTYLILRDLCVSAVRRLILYVANTSQCCCICRKAVRR